jgi:hypothetical protein
MHDVLSWSLYSNADRRLGFNNRNSSPLPPLPVAMERMEPPAYNGGLSNLYYASGTASGSHLLLDDSASSDGITGSGPFSSNSNSLGNVSLQSFFSKLFV